MNQNFRTTVVRASCAALFLGIGASAIAAEAPPVTDNDALITSKVQAALAADKRLQVRAPLDVETRNGVVSIAGDVVTAPMVYRAVEVTRDIEGVKQVNTDRLEAR
ncbi:MAG: BON domain-containing protein [Panacagrimonas sp.]